MVNIKDVAKKAGVSVTTVSHVINKTRFVSEELQAKVKDAMKELDFHPNLMAGSLRRKKTSTIGLIVPDNSNQLFAELSKEVEDILFRSGYSVVLCNSAYDFKRELAHISTLRSKSVDGMIIVPTTQQVEYINRMVESNLPVVVMDRMLPEAKADIVLIDNFQGTHDATEYLIKLGHSSIGYIDRPFDLPHSVDRLMGYKKALEENGLDFQEDLIVRGGFNYGDGAKAMNFLLDRKPVPTAVLAFNDITALGAMRRVQDSGLRVPEDVSVVGFDDIPQSAYTFPRLTTVHFPRKRMAEAACKLLFRRIKGIASEQKKEVILSLHLEVRESTSRVRR
jgi:LacI family transcriptional regulator